MAISFQSSNNNLRKIIIVGIVLIFITLIGSIVFNYYLSQKLAQQETSTPEEEAPQETPKITLPKVLYNLAGVIQKIGVNSLTFEAAIPQLDEAGQLTQKTEIREVMITPTTKFSRLTFITEEGTGRKTPKEISITFQYLKIGDYIEVISNRDISQRQEFEATQIRILPQSF